VGRTCSTHWKGSKLGGGGGILILGKPGGKRQLEDLEKRIILK
jgi:hypothetical protein